MPKDKKRPPRPRTQVPVRLGAELIDRAEEYAAELSFRTGIRVTLSDIIRAGVRHVVSCPLPPMPVRRPCRVSPGAHGGDICTECMGRFPEGYDASLCPRAPMTGEAPRG